MEENNIYKYEFNWTEEDTERMLEQFKDYLCQNICQKEHQPCEISYCISRIEDELKEKDRLLNIFLKVCKDETGYINPNYGNGKLYIDACSEITEEERELFIKFCKENDIKTTGEDNDK